MLALALFPACGSTLASAAEPLRILAAGSLGAVFPKLSAASGLPPETIGAPVFGPAGVLRDRLLADEGADLFASADLAGPNAVAGKLGQVIVVPFRPQSDVLTDAGTAWRDDSNAPRPRSGP